MDEGREPVSMHLKPRHEFEEVKGGFEVDFEHADWVRADGTIPEAVDSEVREDADDFFTEIGSNLRIAGVGVEEVDMDIV